MIGSDAIIVRKSKILYRQEWLSVRTLTHNLMSKTLRSVSLLLSTEPILKVRSKLTASKFVI